MITRFSLIGSIVTPFDIYCDLCVTELIYYYMFMAWCYISGFTKSIIKIFGCELTDCEESALSADFLHSFQ